MLRVDRMRWDRWQATSLGSVRVSGFTFVNRVVRTANLFGCQRINLVVSLVRSGLYRSMGTARHILCFFTGM